MRSSYHFARRANVAVALVLPDEPDVRNACVGRSEAGVRSKPFYLCYLVSCLSATSGSVGFLRNTGGFGQQRHESPNLT